MDRKYDIWAIMEILEKRGSRNVQTYRTGYVLLTLEVAVVAI